MAVAPSLMRYRLVVVGPFTYKTFLSTTAKACSDSRPDLVLGSVKPGPNQVPLPTLASRGRVPAKRSSCSLDQHTSQGLDAVGRPESAGRALKLHSHTSTPGSSKHARCHQIIAMHPRDQERWFEAAQAHMDDAVTTQSIRGGNIHTIAATGATAVDVVMDADSYATLNVLLCLGAGPSSHAQYFPPLCVAAYNGSIQRVSELLTNGKDPDCNTLGFTPLMMAVSRGHLDIAQLLLDSGADVNASTPYCRLTALDMTASPARDGSINEAAVDLLLSYGARVCSGIKACRLLAIAALWGRDSLVRKLVSAGADVNDAVSDDWDDDCRCAYDSYWQAKVKDHTGQLAHLFCSDWTPVMLAAALGHVSTVTVLVELGACLCFNGLHAVHTAVAAGHLDVLQVLAATRVDLSAPALDPLCCTNECTPLHVASIRGDERMVGFLLATSRVQLNALNSHGEAPLWGAAQKGFVGVVQQLLSAGADLRLASSDGLNPLTIAVRWGHVSTVEALLAAYGNTLSNDDLLTLAEIKALVRDADMFACLAKALFDRNQLNQLFDRIGSESLVLLLGCLLTRQGFFETCAELAAESQACLELATLATEMTISGQQLVLFRSAAYMRALLRTKAEQGRVGNAVWAASRLAGMLDRDTFGTVLFTEGVGPALSKGHISLVSKLVTCWGSYFEPALLLLLAHIAVQENNYKLLLGCLQPAGMQNAVYMRILWSMCGPACALLLLRFVRFVDGGGYLQYAKSDMLAKRTWYRATCIDIASWQL